MSHIDDEAQDIDLYQARMLIAFYKAGMANVTGTMEAFTRKMPSNRRFMVVCGVERIISYLKELKLNFETLEIFKILLPEINFNAELCNYLRHIDFAKEITVRAMDDGEMCFASEPVISLSGPIGIIQYVEKKVLSILNHDIRIASKCARIALAARGKPVAEFGGRRGADKMSAEAARAAYIAGFTSTSNVLAYARYGVPCLGTMGHLWPMSFLSEEAKAYKVWGDMFEKSVYLPDTYNLMAGLDKVIEGCYKNIGSIRLDVDDLKNASINVKRRLINSDHYDTQIGATNDLNEYKIAELEGYGCPIDWYGVGTEAVSTPDAPTCNFVFKLVEVNDPNTGKHELVAKYSEGTKGTLPGAKQVYRHFTNHFYEGKPYTKFTHDEICLEAEGKRHNSFGLLRNHTLVGDSIRASANTSRSFFLFNLGQMPEYLKLIGTDDNTYSVILSGKMHSAVSEFKAKHT